MCAKGGVVRLTDPRCELRVRTQRAQPHCSSLFPMPRRLRFGRRPPRCDKHLIVPRVQDIIIRVRTLVMQYHGGQKNYRINSCETPGPVTFWELILEGPLGRQSNTELIRQRRRARIEWILSRSSRVGYGCRDDGDGVLMFWLVLGHVGGRKQLLCDLRHHGNICATSGFTGCLPCRMRRAMSHWTRVNTISLLPAVGAASPSTGWYSSTGPSASSC